MDHLERQLKQHVGGSRVGVVLKAGLCTYVRLSLINDTTWAGALPGLALCLALRQLVGLDQLVVFPDRTCAPQLPRKLAALGFSVQETRPSKTDLYHAAIASHKIRIIASAETLEDQVDMQVTRFLRDAGLARLSGLQAWTPAGQGATVEARKLCFLRPLLKWSQGDILQALKSMPGHEDMLKDLPRVSPPVFANPLELLV